MMCDKLQGLCSLPAKRRRSCRYVYRRTFLCFCSLARKINAWF